MRSLYQYILGSEFNNSCKLEGVTNLCLYYDSFLLLTLVLVVANAFQNLNHFQNLRVFMVSCFQVTCMIFERAISLQDGRPSRRKISREVVSYQILPSITKFV